MPSRFISYRYNTYTDALIAAGTAELVAALGEIRPEEVRLSSEPAGFRIEHPSLPGNESMSESNPFQQIKDKPSREIDELMPHDWDKTQVDDDEENPRWWTTISVINSLASPNFNNKLARQYTPELGEDLLAGTADVKTRSQSQLLYAQASKGVNKSGFNSIATSQGNMSADAEQMVALLGYQVGAAGYIKDEYTISIVPRPKSISMSGYRNLVSGFLRGYFPRTDGGKILPTRDQTVPFFIAMMYFDFIIELFNYQEDTSDMMGGVYEKGAGSVIESLDRALYFSMGTSSAPFATDSLTIPTWLDEKSVAVNVRDLIREMLSERPDPRMLYLPVRAFAEKDPRPLVDFYRQYEPLRKPAGGNRNSKRLLHQKTLRYIMQKTGYDDLNCGAMQRFARALRSRTLTKLYRDSDQPDYNLLTKLRSASRNNDQLVDMLSEFIGSYNLRNARQSAIEKYPDGPNLRYEDLQVIIGLIDKYDAKFVADTLMAQAMSKRDKESAQPQGETATP